MTQTTTPDIIILNVCPAMADGWLPTEPPADQSEWADWAENTPVGRVILRAHGCVPGRETILRNRPTHHESREEVIASQSEKAAFAELLAAFGEPAARVLRFRPLKPARESHDGVREFEFGSPLGDDCYCRGPLMFVALNVDGTRGAVLELEPAHPEYVPTPTREDN